MHVHDDVVVPERRRVREITLLVFLHEGGGLRRLVAPALAEHLGAAVETDTWQIHEQGVADLDTHHTRSTGCQHLGVADVDKTAQPLGQCSGSRSADQV